MSIHPTNEQSTAERACNARLQQKIRALASTLGSASNWMKFVAVLAILGAILSVFGSWLNLLVIWLPIWTSALLFIAADAAASAASSGSERELDRALDRLRLYFKISGILALIGLLLGILGMCVAFPTLLG